MAHQEVQALLCRTRGPAVEVEVQVWTQSLSKSNYKNLLLGRLSGTSIWGFVMRTYETDG